MNINAVSACWSSYPYQKAIQNIVDGTLEPIIGVLAHQHVQLCPQHADYISEPLIDHLMNQFPDIQFRLHADVRLKNKRGYSIDLSDFCDENLWYFQELAQISQQMKAPLYSLHAGRRNGSIDELFEKAKKMEDIFDCPVAIEGLYPFNGHQYFIDSWHEYEKLSQSGCNYAIDLSHLNILATKEGWREDLVLETLSKNQCKEIHVSFNEGYHDSHMIGTNEQKEQWEKWHFFIKNSCTKADIFSEGNQVMHMRKINKT